MQNKKGIQLAISTLILLILGIIVLIGLVGILIMGWGDFKTQIKMFLGSETASAQKECEIQCGLDNTYDYCCGEKMVDDESYTCQSEILKIECILGCDTVTC